MTGVSQVWKPEHVSETERFVTQYISHKKYVFLTEMILYEALLLRTASAYVNGQSVYS